MFDFLSNLLVKEALLSSNSDSYYFGHFSVSFIVLLLLRMSLPFDPKFDA